MELRASVAIVAQQVCCGVRLVCREERTAKAGRPYLQTAFRSFHAKTRRRKEGIEAMKPLFGSRTESHTGLDH